MMVYFDSLNMYVVFQKAVSVTTLTMTPHISGFSNVSPDCNTSRSSAQTDGNSACVCPALASSFVTDVDPEGLHLVSCLEVRSSIS